MKLVLMLLDLGGNFWEQFLLVYFWTVQYCVYVKWFIDFIANYSLMMFVVKLGSRLSRKFVYIAGFQPESNRQWNETNLALLKPFSSPLREVKAAGNFWPRRLFPFESYWKIDLLKKGDGTRKFLLCSNGLTQCGKKPFK